MHPILSLFFRNQPLVVENFNAYIQEYGKINISIITYYEIVSGLKHRDAQKQLNQFAIRNSQFAITFCDGDERFRLQFALPNKKART